jgi:DNA-directed RNA polymerase subunit RPC12/RpoP
MTKESMIKVLRYKAEHIKTRIKPEFFLEVADALEQQPCEDCISRQAVLDKAFEIKTGEHTSAVVVYAHDIRTLPPVKPPKPKTGHWIKITPSGIYMCSECEQNVLTGDIDVYHYCHHCGIKMINVPDINDGKMSETLVEQESVLDKVRAEIIKAKCKKNIGV